MALTGGLRAETGGIELPIHEAWRLRPGGSVRIRAADGARGYLAIGGGLVVERVLGSAATDLRAGFGGLEGRALRAGDRLEVGPMTGRPARWTGIASTGPIRIVAGPHPEAIEALRADWTVAVEADRTGVRLDGPRDRGRRSALDGIAARRDPGPAGRQADRHARRPTGDRRLSRARRPSSEPISGAWRSC